MDKIKGNITNANIAQFVLDEGIEALCVIGIKENNTALLLDPVVLNDARANELVGIALIEAQHHLIEKASKKVKRIMKTKADNMVKLFNTNESEQTH